MKSPMKRAAIGAVAAASLIMAPMSAWAAEEETPAVDAATSETVEKATEGAGEAAGVEKADEKTGDKAEAGEPAKEDKAEGAEKPVADAEKKADDKAKEDPKKDEPKKELTPEEQKKAELKAKQEEQRKKLVEETKAKTEAALKKAKEEAEKAKAEGIVTLNLFNLTDIHGHIEAQPKINKDKTFGGYTESGLASVKCYIDQAKKSNPNTQFTLLGDNIGASPFTSGSANDNPTIEALNAMDVFASTIGNHEFDKGIKVLQERFNGSKDYTKVAFPYLGANVEGLDGLNKDGYKIWETNGVKVAFIGAIENDVATKLPIGTVDTLKFKEAAPVINDIAAKLKDGNAENGEADIVVAMYDNDVLQSYPNMSANVDVIMGGDTHKPYFGYDANPQKNDKGETVGKAITTKDGHPITATASGSFTDNLSNVVVKYDTKQKKVIESYAQKITATEVMACGEDPTVKDIVAKAAEAAAPKKKEVISKGTGNFYRGVHKLTENDSLDAGSNRGTESTIGGLIADAMKDTFTTLDGKPVDIGIINAGGIRADLEPKDGVVTVGDVFAFMPFSNEVSYATLTGAQVKTLLEQQWKSLEPNEKGEKSTRPMLKLGLSSNVKYSFDYADKTKGAGNRVTSILVNSEPLDMNKQYIVGSVSFLMTGGDSFDILKDDAVKASYRVITKGLDRDFMAEYLKKHQDVKPRDHKSSIGVSLSDLKKNGNAVSAQVELRGLSFSQEGEAKVKNVTVEFGGKAVQHEVNNTIVDANATNYEAIITADGVGYTGKFAISADTQCADKAATVHVPLIVKNEAGTELVSAKQGIGVNVNCATGEVTASNGFADKAAGNQKPDDSAKGGNSKGNSSTGESSKGDSSKSKQSSDMHKSAQKSAPKGKLAQTGATVGILAGIAVLTLLGGLVLVRRRQK